MYGVLSEISGILLCYGPLAITVIGFVIFAAITDVGVRQTYLRSMDLRKEADRPEPEPATITQRVTAKTPSKHRVTLVPPAESGGDSRMGADNPTPTGDTTAADDASAESDDAADDDSTA